MMSWTISFLAGAALSWLAILSQKWFVMSLVPERAMISVLAALVLHLFRLAVLAVLLWLVLQLGVACYLLFGAGFITARGPSLYFCVAGSDG